MNAKADRLAFFETLGPPEMYAREQIEIIVRRLADDLLPGSDASRHIGGGNEYAESRPYQAGDSIRRLDWRQTARRGVPFTKQYEALRRMPMYVIVDASASMRISSSPLSKLGAAAWLAAAIGLMSLHRLSPVVVIGGRPLSELGHPSLRQESLWLDLDPLLGGGPAASVPVSESVGHVRAMARSASIIMVLSDFQGEQDAMALRLASGTHDVLALQMIDSAEGAMPRSGFIEAQEAETRRRFLSTPWTKRNRADRIRQSLLESGADTLSLSTRSDIVVEVRRWLTSRGQTTGGQQ